MITPFVTEMKIRLKAHARSVALPESEDPRILAAAATVLSDQVVKEVTLWGNPKAVMDVARTSGIALDRFANQLRWVDPTDGTIVAQTRATLERRFHARGKITHLLL